MNRLVMITGASGGIGQALTRHLAQQGCELALTTREPARLPHAMHTVIAADITSADGARAAIDHIKDRFGRIPDGLAHLAGNTLIAPLHRTTAGQYAEVMRANLDSAFFMLAAFVKALMDAGQSGAAVLVSSVVAQIGSPNHEAIACAKAGVEALVRSAAATYAPSNIRINGVAPGMTDTPLAGSVLRSDASRELASRQYPLAGLNSAEDVAAAIGFLLSEQAGRITGQILAVDGGFTAIRPLVK